MNDIDMPWFKQVGDCWEWTGSRDKDGYGRFGWASVYGRNNRVHRFVLALSIGRLLDDAEVACHTCDNPPCVRPSHLYVGTVSDNSKDMIRRGRGKGQFAEGEGHWNHGLSDFDIMEIRRMYSEGALQRVIAERFNTTQPTISKIVNGVRRG